MILFRHTLPSLLPLSMLIPTQPAQDRRAQRSHAGTEQHVADETAGAGAEEGVARLVGVGAGSARGGVAAGAVGVAVAVGFMGARGG